MDERAEATVKWRAEAVKRAEERIRWEKERDGRRALKGDGWTEAVRSRLVTYWKMGVLEPREHTRLDLVSHTALPASDRKRLSSQGLLTRSLHVIGITRDARGERRDLIDRTLRLKNSGRLHQGSLRVLVFVGPSGHVIGESIQIQGRDAKHDRPAYARYDLDVVSLGDDQLAHFDAHWHHGEDPSAEGDPRWPAMVLDPDEALDVLIEMWFSPSTTATTA